MSPATLPKILYYPERIAEFKATGHTRPINAEVDLTNKCALKCKGCMSEHMRGPQEMDTEQIARIIQELGDLGIISITWTGGGEPLENENWGYAVVKAATMGLAQGLYSCLPALTQDKVNMIDTCCRFVVGHNTPAKVTRPDNSKCKWSCNWLLDSDNWHKWMKMYNSTNFGLFNVAYFRPLVVEGADYDWVKYFLGEFVGAALPNAELSSARFMDLMKPNKGRDYGVCFGTHFSISIGADGTVWECLNRRGIGPSWGNIFQEPLRVIWERRTDRRITFDGCRMLCRNHEPLNKPLWAVLAEPPENVEFA